MFHSALISDSKLLRGILGLRGIAALAVVFAHVTYMTKIKVPEGFDFIGDAFPYGAHLFFVLSAFSLMYSTEHTINRPNWAREYFIKRFFRIAPLFYFLLAAWLAIRSSFPPSTFPDFTTILLNIFFLFGFVQNSNAVLVWAGWTIGVEVIFYVLFPTMIILIKTRKATLYFCILAIAISYISAEVLHAQYLQLARHTRVVDWTYYLFLPNLYFFAFGVFAYRLESFFSKESKVVQFVIPIIAISIISIFMFTNLLVPLQKYGRLDLVVLGCGFVALCIWQSARPTKWVSSYILEYCGERSYSIYLTHPIVIYYLKSYIVNLYAFLTPYIGAYAYFVCVLFVLGVTMLVAETTYRLIETPGIKLGRKLINGQREKSLQAT